MTRIAVIFGARGGIGSATREAFLAAGYRVIPLNSSSINFSNPDSDSKVQEILKHSMADIVVNCVGHFDNKNIELHNKTFDINIGSSWSIIRYYIENPPTAPVKIIMVGSSSYKSGRKSYILYAASKAALYNVWQGACDYFNGSNVTLGLINPVKTRTRILDALPTDICLEPQDVAQEILSMASNNSNQLVDMKYPEEN
jgi:NAD(P)-dependent dehydrogenase (short-subunit alcohol dehydrogenase family)